MNSLRDNLIAIRQRICAAAETAGRDPADIRLVAVSKTHSAESIREVHDAGQEIFGESKIQEASAKISLLPSSLEWHFIGHLQSNKIRKALPLFHLFHGVDSLALATQIQRVAEDCGLLPKVLFEVNVSGEESKFGFHPDRLRAEISGLLSLSRIEVLGLMTMAPHSEDPVAARPYFAALRRLRDELQQQTGHPLPQLSMGMSGDFEAAIAEGSTMVRVGSALFGERQKFLPGGNS